MAKGIFPFQLALGKEASLPSAKYWALGKEGFVECLL
jgi:hypothetical protein